MWATSLPVLAVMFLGLGALVLYTDGTALPDGTAAFAAGIVSLYTEAIGEWSRWIIGAAAFSAMLGTCIACLDGIHGPWRGLTTPCVPRPNKTCARSNGGRWRGFSRSACAHLGLPSDIRTLVDVATTLSFIVAQPWPLPTGTLSAECDSPRPHAHRFGCMCLPVSGCSSSSVLRCFFALPESYCTTAKSSCTSPNMSSKPRTRPLTETVSPARGASKSPSIRHAMPG